MSARIEYNLHFGPEIAAGKIYCAAIRLPEAVRKELQMILDNIPLYKNNSKSELNAERISQSSTRIRHKERSFSDIVNDFNDYD